MNELLIYFAILDHVTQTNEACTGVAPITVGDDGNNSIVIISGANMVLSISDVNAARPLLKTAKVIALFLPLTFPFTFHWL